MSFKLYISNRLEELQGELAKNLQINSKSVFDKDILITQTEGMNRWLSIGLANSIGVFANYEFHKPNGFISSIFKLAGVVDQQDFSTEKIRWVIFQLLDEESFIEQFETVANYYQDDEIKRLQLATRVADLFDQYLIYRPDYIQNWNDGLFAPEIKKEKDQYHEKWQSWLWKRLQEQVDFEDKVALRNRLVDKFKDEHFIKKLQKQYSQVSLFGLSVLTHFHLDIFSWLSKFIDVQFYLLNPSPENYWYDETNEKSIVKIERFTKKNAQELLLQSGNTLLSNWGKIGKDSFTSVFEHDEVLNIMDSTPSIAPEPTTLLSKLQSDIYNNAKEDRALITLDDINDGTLQISSCYTEVREVEALYNYLLDIIDKKATSIAPKDMVILVNDINIYAPFIKAVFDNAALKIPYSIADRSFVGGETISSILELVLKLTVEELTSENALQLLEFDIVKDKFGVQDIELIRRVMNDANIRYGIKGNQEKETHVVSWVYGLERILLGYAIKGGEQYNTPEYSTYPLDTIEGSDFHEIFRFKAFVDVLISIITKRRSNRTLAHWRLYIQEEILERLIEVSDNALEEYHVISEHLALLEEVSGVLNEISYEVFQKAFIDSLVNNVHAGSFITGRVTFCSMIPMRSIPFKLIGLLGMNKDAFPRRENKLGFNLIDIEKRKGDREVKEGDKYLFLEALLSSREYFYLSYIGRNTKDNAVLTPSILIDELLNYIEQGYKGAADHLLVQHPLHGFSHKYFSGGKDGLFTYLEGGSEGNQQGALSLQEKSDYDFSEVTVDQLIRFYKDPIKWYINKELGIYFNDDNILIPEHELFDLDGLQQYQLRKDIFYKLDNETSLSFRDEHVTKGQLPLKNMAEIVLNTLTDEVKEVKTIFNELKEGEEVTIDSDLVIEGTLLSAQIEGVFKGKQLIVSFSKQKSCTKHVIEAWIKHLYLRATGQEIDTYFLMRDRVKPIVIKSELIDQQQAQKTLAELVNYFKIGHNKVIPFIPKWSFYKLTQEKKAEKALEKEIKYNEYVQILEREIFFDPKNIDQELCLNIAKLIYQPIVNLFEAKDIVI